MARVFWKGFRYRRFPDGRIEFLVEFEDRASGTVHRWTPRWSEVFQLSQRAGEVEHYNETESAYKGMLGRALQTATALTRKEELSRPEPREHSGNVVVGRDTDDGWCWCPASDLLDMEDEELHGMGIDGWHSYPRDCCHYCRDNPYHRV